MKKSIFALATCLSLIAMITNATAEARAPSNLGRNYVVSSAALSQWSIGGYYDETKKDVKLRDSAGTYPVKATKGMFYVGYDALPWLSPYLTGGEGEAKIGAFGASSSSKPQYGLGCLINLLDHEVPDPTLLEDRIRINAGMEYTLASADYRNDTLDWQEFDASLTLCIVNDIAGNILFVPDGIGLFAGPIYSSWFGGDIKGLAKSRDGFGFTIGMEVYYTPRVSLNVRANMMKSTGGTAGINVHF